MGFLQVLLLILKILGILIVSVFALVLIAVVLLLFVPLRYRIQGHKAEDYAVEARLSWLLRIIRIKVKYASESKLFYEVRLLWFLLLSNDEAWKTAHEEKKKQKAEKKAQKAEKIKQKQKAKRAKEKKKAKRRKAAGKQSRLSDGNSKSVKQLPETVHEKTQEQTTSENENQATEGVQQDGAEKKNWFLRICDKVKAVIEKIKKTFQSVLNVVKSLWHKADTVINFLKDEANKAAFGASWSTLVQILKHMGPTKIKGYLAFGMEDPATTGYILAVLGIFYSKFGKSFSILPNFEEKQFETELRAKGRVRMSRLLRLALKLWKNKDFKSLLDNGKKLKTDIKTNGG